MMIHSSHSLRISAPRISSNISQGKLFWLSKRSVRASQTSFAKRVNAMKVNIANQSMISAAIQSPNLNSGRTHTSFMKISLGFIFSLACLIPSVSAVNINISSLATHNNGGSLIGTPTAGNWAASQFEVGADLNLSIINQVVLSLEAGGSANTNLSLLSVSLYSDGSGVPGIDLTPGGTGFFNSGTLSAPENVFFTTTTPFTLQANTTYWLVLESSAGVTLADSPRWTYDEDSSSIPLIGINGQINNVTTATFNSGASWNVNANRYYRYAINVPEPSTYVLGSVATGALHLLLVFEKGRTS